MRPILFNTEMVKAILDGRKTVTRRLVKDSRGNCPSHYGRTYFYKLVDNLNNHQGAHAGFYSEKDVFYIDGEKHIDGIYFKQPYRVGDILYAREAWQEVYETEYINFEKGREIKNIRDCITNFDNLYKIECGLSTNCSWGKVEPRMKYIVFKADNLIYPDKDNALKWRPSIHMPKEAARIFLKVMGVRCERLQHITDNGAISEGINPIPRSRELCSTDDGIYPFKALWNSVYHNWDENPWVWVIEFERITKEEAQKG